MVIAFSMVDFLNQNLSEVLSVVVGSIVAMQWVGTKISNSRFTTNLNSISSLNKSVGKLVSQKMEDINSDIKGSIKDFMEKNADNLNAIKNLIDYIQTLIKENQSKDEMVVMMLSMLNVPLEQKENYYNLLKGLSSTNESLLSFLKQSIEQDKLNKEKTIETEDTLEKDLNEV